MKIFSTKEIDDFLSKKDYDIRKSNNARWIDQKCTPDVCTIVADCIVNFLVEKDKPTFTSRDIWFSTYAVNNVQAIFKKADVTSKSTQSEYDKFFQQPMKLFAYAGILQESKNGRENVFEVVNLELLEYIALAEKFALFVLQSYINKVLEDSGLLAVFSDFFKLPNKINFEKTKEAFYRFAIENTPIGSRTSKNNTTDKPSYTECGRIFTKIINPLAFKYNSLGTERGYLSKKKITYDMLMYNRDNFRDIYSEKPKDMARKDYEKSIEFSPSKDYYKYLSSKAKQFIKTYNMQYRNSMTELLEADEQNVPATQMHHIFLESEFPMIAHYLENIIALTPNQHMVRAHPMNKTSVVDTHYQHQCLISKADRIKENIESDLIETIYDFNKFLHVIFIGLSDDSYLEIDKYDYNGVKAKLGISYGA